MAVLIMIFAALLGATFITVVALNLNQTARDEDRVVAAQNARAGLRFVNEQLTNSAAGDRWRPTDVNTPPIQGQAAYNEYYSPFDQAQGWAQRGLVKFPDPRSENVSDNSPTFLVEVKKLGDRIADPADNAENDKTGALRISVIGLTPNNPAVFSRITAYKPGPAQKPLTSAARSVTNWDYINQRVPEAEVESNTGATLIIKNIKGTFPSTGGFYIAVGDPITNNGARVVAVDTYTDLGGGRAQVTLTTTTVNAMTGERVEMAAVLGAPTRLDYNNDGSRSPTIEDVNFRLSEATTPGSIWVNGSLGLIGNVMAENLRPRDLSTSTSAAGFIKSSGIISYISSSTNATAVTVSGTSASGTLTNAPLSTSSSDTNFPGASGGWSTFSPQEKDALVTDAWNRLAGSPDSVRQAVPFVPSDITTGGNGFGRYRQLSKYSDSAVPSIATAALYGYGTGIYINNINDKERIGTGVQAFREMTQDEMRKMWFDGGTGQSFYRLGTPAVSDESSTSTHDKSLEEQHLRGWVGPDEFRARGALIEINGNNTITVTLDARTDGIVDADPNRTWRDANGTPLSGVYSRTFNWPLNGVIFAEGNIRIKGTAANPPRSLTVVSMNNIYIEGSVGAGATRKILLLAKKNVVLNPTRVVGRPDAFTLLRSAIPAAGSNRLDVYNAAAFQPGDWVFVNTTSFNDPGGCVTAVSDNGTPDDFTDDFITLDRVVTTQPAGLPVQTRSDPPNGSGLPYTRHANRLERFNQALQRQLTLPAGTNQLRLTLRHSGERRAGLTVKTEDADNLVVGYPVIPAKLNSAFLENKLAPNGQSVIEATQKLLKVSYNESLPGANGTDQFPAAVPTAEPTAQAYRVGELTDSDTSSDTDDLAEEMNRKRISPADNWNYVATVENSYDNISPSIAPFFFLASVGNRYDFGLTPGTGYPWRKSILYDVNPPLSIPMATSVVVTLNNAGNKVLRNDRFNTTTSSYEAVTQFGFNLWYGAPPTDPTTAVEDVLTADQSFYNGTTETATTKYAFDSRVMSGAQGGNNSLAFRLNDFAEAFFRTTAVNGKIPSIPYYRLARIKLENVDQHLTSPGVFDNLQPIDMTGTGITIDVNAFVYAQEGSWIVIPGDYFDSLDQLKYAFLGDINGNGARDPNELIPYISYDNDSTPDPGEYIDANGNGTIDRGEDANGNFVLDALEDLNGNGTLDLEGPDLNRDGVFSRDEQVAVLRYRRYNYKISFTGAIMENQTALVVNTGTLTGMVQDWMDKWATVSIDPSNFSSPGTNGAFMNNLRYKDTSGNITGDFSNITYKFDDAAARDLVDADITDPRYVGFHPPTTPELMYQG